MNSKCGVQSKRKRESHESSVCIARFSACGCKKKSVMYETECRHLAVHKGKQDQREIIALKHIQATLYLIRSEMGSQCSFTRRGVECWWQGAKRTSLAAKC